MTPRISFVALTASVLLASSWASPLRFSAAPLAPQQTQPPAPAPQQDEVAVSLVNPGSQQRLGLPDFLVEGADAEITAVAKTIADVLWSDIDFEREFYMIGRQRSASIPVAPYTALPFDRWSELGADAVLAGQIRRSGAEVTVELRMIGVRGDAIGRQQFGEAYTCGIKDPRFCAHAMADAFHEKVAALEGVARTKLAFSSDRAAVRVPSRPSQTEGQSKEIYISDYDGFNQRRLTANGSLNLAPAWSPVPGVIAFDSYSSGYPDIHVMNILEPGRAHQRPARGSTAVHNRLSAWSPDGTKLAFVSNRAGNPDIFVINRDGSGLRQLTTHPGADQCPTWSPNGDLIAFTSDRATGTEPQLYVMNSAGGNQRRLTGERIDRPTWSKLNFIAFTVGTGPGNNIGILDMSSSSAGGVKILTDSRGTNESPAVSPNGRHIAFVTTRWGRQHIAIIDRNGDISRVRQVTTVGNNTYPNWQPITKR
jgi:TolB protein